MTSLLTIKGALTVSDRVDEKAIVKTKYYQDRVIMVPPLYGSQSDSTGESGFSLLHPSLKATLQEDLKLNYLFPVQAACVPLVVNSHNSPISDDICISVPTGQGKTLAYVLPIIHCLIGRQAPALKAVILVPTRDLAKQVGKVVKSVIDGVNRREAKSHLPLTSLTITGQEVFTRPECIPDILIATVGRFADFVASEHCSLSHLRWLVIDEADRMLGGDDAVRWLAVVRERVGTDCQKLLFSATMTRNPQKLELMGIKRVLFVNCEDSESKKAKAGNDKDTSNDVGLSSDDTDVEKKRPKKVNSIQHSFYNCKDAKHKLTRLVTLLKTEKPGKCMIFTNSVQRTKEAVYSLVSANVPDCIVKEFDGKILQTDRDRILKELQGHKKSKGTFCLVCSDLATRGLDIGDIDLVVNLEIPSFANTYVHRVGRTGRAGKSGKAISLVERKEADFFRRTIVDKCKEKHNIIIKKTIL